nr:MAG TPA: hypothetical protein [Microviridae sp.]
MKWYKVSFSQNSIKTFRILFVTDFLFSFIVFSFVSILLL